jgi:hypothetical protein
MSKSSRPASSQTKTPKGSPKTPTGPGKGGNPLGRFAGGKSQVKTPVGTKKVS